MAYFSGTIYSKCMDIDTPLVVILPQESRPHMQNRLANGAAPRETPRTLILLHGLSDNGTSWSRRTSIERYAEDYDVAVVMPDVQKSFYQDMKYGAKYFTYITEELPEICNKLFHLSTKPEDLMIAGLSMGGYGALRCALTYPERYSVCGAFSAGWDVEGLMKGASEPAPGRPEMPKDTFATFGEPIEIPDEVKIPTLLEKFNAGKEHLKLYMTIGTEDFLYESNQQLKAMLEKSRLDEFVYEEWPGIHEWKIWDRSVQHLIEKYVK